MDELNQQVTDETVVMTPESTDTPEIESAGDQPTMAPEVVSDGEQPTSAPPLDPAYENRRQRIFDLRAAAQGETNPETACLAGVESDLFDLELNLGESLRHAMATGMSIDDIERYSLPMNMFLRVTKQLAQITQLVRLTRKDGESAPTNPRERTEAKKAPGCAPPEMGNQFFA